MSLLVPALHGKPEKASGCCAELSPILGALKLSTPLKEIYILLQLLFYSVCITYYCLRMKVYVIKLFPEVFDEILFNSFLNGVKWVGKGGQHKGTQSCFICSVVRG
jgi:hypothetical protein